MSDHPYFCLALLDGHGLISVSGQEVQNYLQGLVTIDIRDINANQYRFAGACNRKGKLVASFDLFKYQDAYYFSLPKTNIPFLLRHFQKYALFSKVLVKDVSNDFLIFWVLLQKKHPPVFASLLKSPFDYIEANGFAVLKGQENPCDPKEAFQVVLEKEKQGEFFENLGFSGCPEMISEDDRLWRKYNISWEIPYIRPEMSELFIPQMLNFSRLSGLSLTKGCYLGQEIVARTDSLGAVKRHLCALKIKTCQPVVVGDELTNDQAQGVGVVFDVCHFDGNTYILAVVQDLSLNNVFWKNNAAIPCQLGEGR